MNLLGKPYTSCWRENVGLHDTDINDCPCTAQDARVPWPEGPDGYRQPENLTGVELFDLDIHNYQDTGQSFGDSWIIAHGPINEKSPFTWDRGSTSTEFDTQFTADAVTFKKVKDTNRPNYQEARVPLQHGLHIDIWRQELSQYHEQRLVEYLEFGFPLGYIAMHPPEQNSRNHGSSTNYLEHVDKYLSKELGHGSLIGPFHEKPTDQTHMNPLMSRPKKDSSDRIGGGIHQNCSTYTSTPCQWTTQCR